MNEKQKAHTLTVCFTCLGAIGRLEVPSRRQWVVILILNVDGNTEVAVRFVPQFDGQQRIKCDPASEVAGDRDAAADTLLTLGRKVVCRREEATDRRLSRSSST